MKLFRDKEDCDLAFIKANSRTRRGNELLYSGTLRPHATHTFFLVLRSCRLILLGNLLPRATKRSGLSCLRSWSRACFHGERRKESKA